MQTRVRYLVPPGIADKDLPPEVRIGLRLAARIAARLTREQARTETEKPGDKPEMIP